MFSGTFSQVELPELGVEECIRVLWAELALYKAFWLYSGLGLGQGIGSYAHGCLSGRTLASTCREGSLIHMVADERLQLHEPLDPGFELYGPELSSPSPGPSQVTLYEKGALFIPGLVLASSPALHTAL